jgi:hypothetical protein
MEINFKIAESDTMYLLTEPEEELMNTIAETEGSVMSGYACAILSLCAGYSCELTEGESESLQSPFNSSPLASLPEQEMSIYPNPGEGMFEIRFYVPDETSIRIHILNITGKSVYLSAHKVKGFVNERVKLAEPGLYFVHLMNGNQIIDVQKVVIQ